jgi:hypothetical protein
MIIQITTEADLRAINLFQSVLEQAEERELTEDTETFSWQGKTYYLTETEHTHVTTHVADMNQRYNNQYEEATIKW